MFDKVLKENIFFISISLLCSTQGNIVIYISIY